ncbi:hypothetical protein ACJ7VE_15400 [Streptomyces sp. PB17]|uniref:hypothetical protein n=1 Tax=Streptomyces sp. PB17 TaxID=3384158 RepID=UPI0038B44873
MVTDPVRYADGRLHVPSGPGLGMRLDPDRTEIARINMNADKHDIRQGGHWSANPNPPYASGGTLSGPTWTVRLKGATNQEIKDNFTYTAAARNKNAPAFTSPRPLTAVTTATGGRALRVAQATDDQMVHHYDVTVTDATTGTVVVSSKVLSEYFFRPRPNTLDVPVPAGATGTRYTADVRAVDAYGNASPTAALTFTQ